MGLLRSAEPRVRAPEMRWDRWASAPAWQCDRRNNTLRVRGRFVAARIVRRHHPNRLPICCDCSPRVRGFHRHADRASRQSSLLAAPCFCRPLARPRGPASALTAARRRVADGIRAIPARASRCSRAASPAVAGGCGRRDQGPVGVLPATRWMDASRGRGSRWRSSPPTRPLGPAPRTLAGRPGRRRAARISPNRRLVSACLAMVDVADRPRCSARQGSRSRGRRAPAPAAGVWADPARRRFFAGISTAGGAAGRFTLVEGRRGGVGVRDPAYLSRPSVASGSRGFTRPVPARSGEEGLRG